MSDLSRRNFLAHGAAAAGAVVVVGQLGDGTASAATSESGAATSSLGGWFGDQSTTSEPFVVYIRDAAKGEVSVLRGEEEIVYTDRALVGRLQRAMRRAAW